MAEYIERNEPIAALNKIRDDQRVFKYATASDFLSARDAIERAIKVLERLPAADVAPVRHGEWEIVVGSNGKEYMVCTCCRVSQDLTGVFSYCPNCGAKMDLEEV